MTTQFRWSRVPALLAYLVLHPGDNPRELVAEVLWPDRSGESARQNLRQTLLYIQRLFESCPDEVLNVTRQSIGFRAGTVWSDADAFLFRSSKKEENSSSIAHQERLIRLYRGSFLAQLEDDWIVESRAQIARLYFDALVCCSGELLATDPSRALELAELATHEEPFDDSARAAKIRALKRQGREASAQKEFVSYAALLKEQLELQPGKLVSQALTDEEPSQSKTVLAVESLDASQSSIGETLQFLRDQGMLSEAVDLAMALVPFWIRKGTPAQGQSLLLSTFIDADRRVGDFEKVSIARLTYAQGDNLKAREIAMDLLENSNSPNILAEANFLCARTDLRDVKPWLGLRHALCGLRLARALGDKILELDGWRLVAFARFGTDQFSRVERPAVRAINLGLKSGDQVGRHHVEVYRAYAFLRLGRRDEAQIIANEIRAEMGPATSLISSQIKCGLGRLMEDLGQVREARETYLACIADSKRLGNIFTTCVALTYLGDLSWELGNYGESLEYHFEALKTRRDLDQNLGIATSLRGIGRALLAKGMASEARSGLQESAQRFRDENAVSGHASAQLLLAEAEYESGNGALARRLAEHSVDVLRSLSPDARLSIGPSGAGILEKGERLLKTILGTNREVLSELKPKT